MSWDLVADTGEIVPDTVLRAEDFDWWGDLRDIAKEHGKFDIGPERRSNATSSDWESLYSNEIRAVVEARYAGDVERFYQ